MKRKVKWQDIEDGYDKYKAYLKSDEWKKVQEVVKEKFEGHCAFCGRSEEQLYIHHNSYTYLYDELNHIDCVIPLCKVCHLAGHKVRRNWKQFAKPKKD